MLSLHPCVRPWAGIDKVSISTLIPFVQVRLRSTVHSNFNLTRGSKWYPLKTSQNQNVPSDLPKCPTFGESKCPKHIFTIFNQTRDNKHFLSQSQNVPSQNVPKSKCPKSKRPRVKTSQVKTSQVKMSHLVCLPVNNITHTVMLISNNTLARNSASSLLFM